MTDPLSDFRLDGDVAVVTGGGASQGIRVNAVAPTWVRTPLTRGITEKPELVRRIEQMTPMGRFAEPGEIVGAVVFLASRASAMVTGHVLAIDGGFLAQ